MVTMRRALAALFALFALLAFVTLQAVPAIAASADSPEARDPNVKRCADTAGKRLAGGGFDGARAAGATARRADACILRWEERFSASNATKVATLVVVPIDTELLAGATRRKATLHARCGFNDGKLRAFEIVEQDKSC